MFYLKWQISLLLRTKLLASAILLLAIGLLLCFTLQSAWAAPAITATRVYGQTDNFTTGTANNKGISANSLDTTYATAIDSTGRVYVTDFNNNRVLSYPPGSATADRVYGQGGSFINNTANNGGISANSLNAPIGITVDSSGRLYVTDFKNNRVLSYPAGNTTADRVYGQGGSFTTNTANNGGISASSLAAPAGVTVDSSGRVYIADYNNSRVLSYQPGSITADRVYGQGGNFTTNTLNNGGISASSLSAPVGLTVDSTGRLYVTDLVNSRVLSYPTGSTTADRVYGQGGSFTTGTANNGGISASSLRGPAGVTVDSTGRVYIADFYNSRVLSYPPGSITADRVYGQGGSFTTNTANNGGISASSLAAPGGVALDKAYNLYVNDTDNSRVLFFPNAPASATASGGATQSAAVSAAFATPLSVTVKDAEGNPLSGVSVTFAAPASGASATLSAPTATTNAQGIASVTATANATLGTYNVTASATGVATPATFTLTNTVGAPASITVTGGGTQSANISTLFTTALSVVVKDAAGNPLSGVTVAFTAPASGASASLSSPTATTNAQGVASVIATANTTLGTYNVTAAAPGVATPATFALTNTAGVPASVTLSGGGTQAANTSTAFATPLAVTVKDAGGNPVSGVIVIFAVPTNGASAILSSATATTNAQGSASVTATANATAGTYSVSAFAPGVANSATFSLTNTTGAPASVTVSGGNNQSAQTGAAFATSLSVLVKDAGGNPASGVTVTFSVPTSGASAILSSATATTNAQGSASVTATANATAGSYTVSASVNGVATPVTFNLTNQASNAPIPASVIVTGGNNQSATVGTAFTTPLQVQVKDAASNPVANVIVTFTVNPAGGAGATLSSATATTNANGVASITATANNTAGNYTVSASVNGVASPASFNLTNTAGPVSSPPVNLLPTTIRVATTTGPNPNSRLLGNGAAPKIGDASTVQLNVSAVAALPASATGIVGILTSINCESGGNLRFWTGNTVPASVNLNVPGSSLAIPGATAALNLSTSFIAPLDSNGKVYLGWSSAVGKACGYAVDVSGYLTTTSPFNLLGATSRIAATFGTGANSKLIATANGPAIGTSSSVLLTVGGTNGIPANASGIFGILTNVECNGGGNLRFWTGSTVPTSVNLNVPGSSLAIPGATTALNLSTSFVAPLDANGKVYLGWSSAVGKSCGYAVDVVGYLTNNPSSTPLNLLANTVRAGLADGSSGNLLKATTSSPAVGDTSTVTLAIGGTSGIPATAKGVIGIVTNISCNAGGNLRFWTGATTPTSVNLNVPGGSLAIPGATTALNLSTGFVAPLDSSGKVNLGWSSGASNTCGYAVDIVGYF